MTYKKQYFVNLTYHGKTYNNLNKFAIDNHADFRQVYNNYHRGVRDPEHLLMSSPWLYDIHALGLLTISEVAEKTNLPNTLLYSTLHNILKNPGSTRLGLTENDIVALDALKLSYVPKSPKYVFKKSVLNHIEAYGSKLAHSKLLVIPQLMPIYLWDSAKHELWSSTHGQQGVYRKRKMFKEMNAYWYHIMLESNGMEFRITKSDIEDLFKYPTLRAEDLIGLKQILTSYPCDLPNGSRFYKYYLSKHFYQMCHKRFTKNSTVYGLSKKETLLLLKKTQSATKTHLEHVKEIQLQSLALGWQSTNHSQPNNHSFYSLAKAKHFQDSLIKKQAKTARMVMSNAKIKRRLMRKLVKILKRKIRIKEHQIIHDGHVFNNYREVADFYHISYDLLLARKEHGVTNFNELVKQPKRGSVGRKMQYKGHTFSNLHELANYIGIPYSAIYNINHLYQIDTAEDFIKAVHLRKTLNHNTPLPFPRRKRNNKSIVLLGHTYKSVREAAQLHNLTPSTVYGRIRKHGKNYEHLFDRPIDTTTI